MLPKAMSTTWADIKTFIAILQLCNREMEITEATRCRVRLAGYLTITLKKITQRLNHLIEIKITRLYFLYAKRSNNRKSSGYMVCAIFTSTGKRAIIARMAIVMVLRMVMAQ